MEGFFPTSTLISKAPLPLVAKCNACGLHRTCKSPKMKVSGGGRKEILLVGEAPGADEDSAGIPFVGKTGKFLRDMFYRVGIDMRSDCHITNALICRPPKNADPTTEQINYCLPNLKKTIEDLEPKVIIPVGAAAIQAILTLSWKAGEGGVFQWAGWRIPCQKFNAWVCPTFHPSFVLRQSEDKNRVPALLMERHLSHTASLKKRPWKALPDYQSAVERIFSPTKAARIIRRMISKGGTMALDFETDRLKPDHPDRRIVSASICWRGKKTIAYPFQGEAIKATREFIRSPWPKIGAINKFEDRWSMAVMGCRVRNWYWDVCQGAHWGDNRRGITSVKFQSYALLGLESYNEHIEPLLHDSENSNSPNRIDEIDLDELLLYNGMDSLIEYLVAMKQMKTYNYPLPE